MAGLVCGTYKSYTLYLRTGGTNFAVLMPIVEDKGCGAPSARLSKYWHVICLSRTELTLPRGEVKSDDNYDPYI